MENAVALGTFDGVHKGHRAVLNMPQNYRKTVVTFKVPPKAFFTGETSLITTVKDKYRILKSIGIDEILILDFNEVRNTEPLVFLEQLLKKYNPRLICCGFNYRFGKNGGGDVNTIKEFCLKNRIEFKAVNPVTENGQVISSTVIREYLKNGEIEKANGLLTEPFSFEAIVQKGDQRGRTIGFPTVNQKYPNELVKLHFGVYKTKIDIDGKTYFGITDIGIRPTFELPFVISETYIQGYSGDLYGEKLRITPLKFLREEIKFNSIDELRQQILTDINSIEEIM